MIDYVFQKGGTLNLYFILCATPGYFTVNCISYLCFIRNKFLFMLLIYSYLTKLQRSEEKKTVIDYKFSFPTYSSDI